MKKKNVENKMKHEITFDTPMFDEDGKSIFCKSCVVDYKVDNGHYPSDFYPEMSKEMLDGGTCDCGECDGIMFQHQKCHNGEGFEVFYAQGYLYAQCWICRTPVWKIRIA